MKKLAFLVLVIIGIQSCAKYDSFEKPYFDIEGEWKIESISYIEEGKEVILDTVESTVLFENCIEDSGSGQGRCNGTQSMDGKIVEFGYFIDDESFDVNPDINFNDYSSFAPFTLGLSSTYQVDVLTKDSFIFMTDEQIRPNSNLVFEQLTFTLVR